MKKPRKPDQLQAAAQQEIIDDFIREYGWNGEGGVYVRADNLPKLVAALRSAPAGPTLRNDVIRECDKVLEALGLELYNKGDKAGWAVCDEAGHRLRALVGEPPSPAPPANCPGCGCDWDWTKGDGERHKSGCAWSGFYLEAEPPSAGKEGSAAMSERAEGRQQDVAQVVSNLCNEMRNWGEPVWIARANRIEAILTALAPSTAEPPPAPRAEAQRPGGHSAYPCPKCGEPCLFGAMGSFHIHTGSGMCEPAAPSPSAPAPPALIDAVRALYYAGVWTCDRPVDEAGLWTAVRDAAGFPKGQSPKPVADPAPPPLDKCADCGSYIETDGAGVRHHVNFYRTSAYRTKCRGVRPKPTVAAAPQSAAPRQCQYDDCKLLAFPNGFCAMHSPCKRKGCEGFAGTSKYCSPECEAQSAPEPTRCRYCEGMIAGQCAVCGRCAEPPRPSDPAKLAEKLADRIYNRDFPLKAQLQLAVRAILEAEGVK